MSTDDQSRSGRLLMIQTNDISKIHEIVMEDLKRLLKGLRQKNPDLWLSETDFSTMTTFPLIQHSLCGVV